MPDDDREDTATGAPVTAPVVSPNDEELPTSITTSPVAAISQALSELAPSTQQHGEHEEEEPASDDGPTGIAKSPSVEAEHSPADDDGPTSISRVALDDNWESSGAPVAAGAPPETNVEPDPQDDGPTGVTKVELPPPDEVPTGRTARPAGIVVPGARPPEEKRPGSQDPEEDSQVTLQKVPPPAKSAPRIAAATPPPRGKQASDIYDVDDDKTERRDLPTDEINRAIARAKLEPVAISELPDESPTARRADLAITPKSGVRAAQVEAEEEESSELPTETDIGPIVRQALDNHPVRPPFGSESDNVITEPAIDREERVPKASPLPKTTMAMSQPKSTLMGVAPPPPRPPEQSLGTDSYTFQGGAAELQAVIPMSAAAKSGANASQPPSNGLLLSAAGAPSTQNLAVQTAPPLVPTLPPPPAAAAAMALMPTAPASFPPGLPPGALSGTIQPASGPPSGRMQIAGSFPPPLGSAPNGLGLPNSTPRPVEEPRWIVLVLGVLAVCILIPTILYLVLRSRSDDAEHTDEGPVRGVVTVQTAQPIDHGKVERRR